MSLKREAALKWNELVKKLNELEEIALELMRHPDATDEQIVEVARRYSALYQNAAEKKQAVRAAVSGAYPLNVLRKLRGEK